MTAENRVLKIVGRIYTHNKGEEQYPAEVKVLEEVPLRLTAAQPRQRQLHHPTRVVQYQCAWARLLPL